MPGRRGARAGRGWDAIPPRPADDDPADGEPRPGETERGNVPARRRRGSPGASSAFGAAIGGSGTERTRGRSGITTFGGSGTDRPAKRPRRESPENGRADFGVGPAPAPPPPPPQTESERAREICLNQLSARPRTRVELAKVLTRKEISAEVIAEVLDRYDEVGIIDDAAFARAWVSSRHNGRGLARRALANELRQRGVDAEVASEALETVDDESEAATARALVDRKLRTATGAPEAVFRRLVGMLARKGYSAGLAYRVVKDALAARDAEAAEFADQIDADDFEEQ